jgi:hypothetical protein
MDPNNLSPEKILQEKEKLGGISFDDRIADLNPINPLEERAQREAEALAEQAREKTSIVAETKLAQQIKSDQDQKSNFENSIQKQFSPSDLGWKNLPPVLLPSGGLFYPEGVQIAIRPAEVKEIRHYSTIDETDMLDIDSKLNLILERCCVVKFPQHGVVSYKEIKQEDRFFIIMTIRDLTFVRGENMVVLKPQTSCETSACPFEHGIELRTGVLSKYTIDDKLMSYYSKTDRKFVLHIQKLSKTVKMTVPSIGVVEAISTYARTRIRQGKDVDESFIKIAPYLYDDWRSLTENKLAELEEASNAWSKEEFSLFFQITDLLKIGTKLEVSVPCPKCGAQEVTAPIYFPEGIRSLFVISDIFGQLL